MYPQRDGAQEEAACALGLNASRVVHSPLLERDRIHIDKRTAVTRWDGSRCNYGMGVESLMNVARKPDAASGYEETPFEELDHSVGASIARWREVVNAATRGDDDRSAGGL